MTKILFIQGVHNFSLTERFIKDVEEATGMEVIHFPALYGLGDTKTHQHIINQVNAHIENGADRYILLGHSFGGILAHCLSDKAYAKVDRLITFATPHTLPFGWFKNILRELPYRAEVPVSRKDSCGFFLDSIVPFIFTRDPHASHANFLGTHTRVLNRKAFFNRLIVGK